MMARKTVAQLRKEFTDRHRGDLGGTGVKGTILLPSFISDLVCFGGLPYLDWVSLKDDERFTKESYALPMPLYDHEESCESCGLIYEDEILCVACPLDKEQLTNSGMVVAAWKRASIVLGVPEIARRYDLPEYDMDMKSSLLWLARMLRLLPGEAGNRDQMFKAIDELPIHFAANYNSTDGLCRDGVSVFTIEMPNGTYYVQFVGKPLTETPETLPMSSDEAEMKAVEAAQQNNAIVQHNEGVIAAKPKTQVLSKKARMKQNLKKIQAHRKR
jgi:hypothetical protein